MSLFAGMARSNQIGVLEKSVAENKDAAETKEKAVTETMADMEAVAQDKTWLDTCLREACDSIQRCLALLSEVECVAKTATNKYFLSQDVAPEEVEQKARREDVLNQLLLLLNTAINRSVCVLMFVGLHLSSCPVQKRERKTRDKCKRAEAEDEQEAGGEQGGHRATTEHRRGG